MGTPCVNVPGLHDASGMPLGVQVVGRFGRDHEALFAARFLEEAIAAALGRPVGTIKTWLHRARLELLDALRRRGMVEPAMDGELRMTSGD